MSALVLLLMMAANPVQSARLVDGTRVLVVNRPESQMVSVQWVIHAGANDEANARPGLAHLLEHMVFRGATAEVERAKLARLGATTNARTMSDQTVYELDTSAAAFNDGFASFVRMLTNPDLLASSMTSELGVVMHEQQLRRAGRGGSFERAVFSDSVVGGTEDTLPKISRSDLVSFLERFYVPANSTVVVVGPVTLDGVRGVLEAESRWPPSLSAAPLRAVPPVPPRVRVSLSSSPTGLAMVAAAFPSSELAGCERYAATLHLALVRALSLDDRTALNSSCLVLRGSAFALVAGDSMSDPVLPLVETMVGLVLKGLKPPGPRDLELIQRRLVAQHAERTASPRSLATHLASLAPYLQTEELEAIAGAALGAPVLTPPQLTQTLRSVTDPIVIIDGPFPSSMTGLKESPRVGHGQVLER